MNNHKAIKTLVISGISREKSLFIRDVDKVLATIAQFLILRNKKGLTDDNKEYENLLLPLLELIFKTKFATSENIIKPGADIFANDNSIAIQITSENSKQKIKDSLLKFYKHNLDKEYKRLVIVFLKIDSVAPPKPSVVANYLKKNGINHVSFCFKNDIYDFTKISKIIASESPIDLKNYIPVIDSLRFFFNDEKLILERVLESRNSYLKKGKPNNLDWSKYLLAIKNTFEPINILPSYIIRNIRTNGKFLFSPERNGFYSTKDIDFIKTIESSNEGKNDANDFLLGNGIAKIYHNREEIKIESKSQIDCPICLTHNFDLIALIKENDKPVAKSMGEIGLAFLNYIYGNKEKAVDIYIANMDDKGIEGFLCYRNLTELNKHDYQIELPESIRIKLEHDWISKFSLNSDLHSEHLYLINLINEKHYQNIQYKYISNLEAIEDKLKYYKESSNCTLANTLISQIRDVHKVIRFATHNYLIMDLQYANIQQTILGVFRLLFKVSEKVDVNKILEISHNHIKEFLFYIEPRDLAGLVSKYSISNIFKSDSFIIELSPMLNHILAHKNWIKEKLKGGKNIPIIKMIVKYLNNIIIILPFSEGIKSSFDSIISQYLQLIIEIPLLNHEIDELLLELIVNNINSLDKTTISKTVNLFNNNSGDNYLLISLFYFVEIKHQSINLDNYDDYLTFNMYTKLSSANKREFNARIIKSLDEKFQIDLFFKILKLGIINFIDYKERLFKDLIRAKEIVESKEPFIIYEAKNKIIKFIEFYYSSNISFSDDEINMIIPDSEYYKWLFRPHAYNYSLFNSYWVSEVNSVELFKNFSTIPELIKIIERDLKHKNDRNLAYIYFEYLINK